MAKLDPAVVAHLEWLGFIQPTGLVVSAPALVRAGAILDRSDIEGQRRLRGCLAEREFDPQEGPTVWLPDFRTFASAVLGWSFSPKGYAGMPESPIPSELEFPLVDYSETLRPDFAVREMEPREGQPPWQLLVRALEPGQDFDRVVRGTGQLEASEHGRMERLLREKRVPAGLLFNGRVLRLLSAPRGESSGWLDFRVTDMEQTTGRPISTALRLLLGEPRLLALPASQRLAALLEDSRKFQNEVSERLAEQVLHALYELLRGFQAAHDASKGELLRQPLAEHSDEVYRALLTVILRLVFLLYAEERDMLPEDETYLRYYSLAGLYERLREDAALFPDTMDQRYGAWAQLLVLFRMVHDGAESGAMRLPKRHGVLFDPDRFKFLEGRASGGARQIHEGIEPPLVPDGTIYRAFEKLLVLDGERISYRALDVEQIGSVYETMMGFRLETATGRSVAIRARKKQGAPTAVDLETLLGEPAVKREKWLQGRADREISNKIKKAVREAATLEDLHAALLPVIDRAATPDLVPKGAMVLQPSEERRRSGSHYTPRSLTEPIVRTTLDPILARLCGADGQSPRPAQILELRVCDPTMGSGAFLVEACRQLGDALVEAWHAHSEVPAIPPDEDEVILARRLIAQRCLYGVDRNPVAVDLAKVSLWLVTLAKDHALTFVDHALRHGDSVVGLSWKQIEAFHWDPDAPRFQAGFETMRVREHVEKVAELRRRIREADESVSDSELRDLWDEAQFELGKVRLVGDLVAAAFFDGERPKGREAKRSAYASAIVSGDSDRYHGWLAERRYGEQPLAPFHWEIEFPEVFERENPGFDAFVGNPPFLGGSRITSVLGETYRPWLVDQYTPGQVGRVDLVAYFFIRASGLLRRDGQLGLMCAERVLEGDGKRVMDIAIRRLNAHVLDVADRQQWPGEANVMFRVAYIRRGAETIRPHVLQAAETDAAPIALAANANLAWRGTEVRGDGFFISDEERTSLLSLDPDNAQVITECVNGKDINSRPDAGPGRWIINFGTMSYDEASRFAEPFRLVTERVKPYRDTITKQIHEQDYWKYWDKRVDSYAVLARIGRCLATSEVATSDAFAWVHAGQVLQNTLVLVLLSADSAFALLQSRLHWLWVRSLSSAVGATGIRYSPSRCFDTFPLPEGFEMDLELEAVGKAYEELRVAVMVKNNEGLTKTFNRLHDPDERQPDILKLRELHAAMDRAVLDAYGWSDVPTDCEFFLDFEIDEEEWGNKKKPWRYRWPDEVRDQLLARLLELNAECAKVEERSGAEAKKVGKKRPARRIGQKMETEQML